LLTFGDILVFSAKVGHESVQPLVLGDQGSWGTLRSRQYFGCHWTWHFNISS
jgi:hypothetical protein